MAGIYGPGSLSVPDGQSLLDSVIARLASCRDEMTVSINVGSEAWSIDLREGKLEQVALPEADVRVSATFDTWMQILSGKGRDPNTVSAVDTEVRGGTAMLRRLAAHLRSERKVVSVGGHDIAIEELNAEADSEGDTMLDERGRLIKGRRRKPGIPTPSPGAARSSLGLGGTEAAPDIGDLARESLAVWLNHVAHLIDDLLRSSPVAKGCDHLLVSRGRLTQQSGGTQEEVGVLVHPHAGG